MKCVYRERMGMFNPICENVGEIRKIIPNYPAAQETYSHINEIETDEFVFGCDTKYRFVKHGGFCRFHPLDRKEAKTKFVQMPTIDGGIIDVKPHTLYLDGHDAFTPITTDPRVLCIMHRANDLPLHPTEAQIKAFCAHIPTWDEATAYLKKIGALMDCVPEEEMYRNMKREEK